MQQPLHKAICHVDLDAFYSQVEVKQHPELRSKPVGVVQYNPFGNLETRRPDENRVMNDSNGSLIAVSYEARAQGVKRNMRGNEARAACPDIQLVQVPTAHGKADLTLYRSEGKRVLDILARLAKTERASIDECYLDLTEEAQRRLEACGGVPPLPCNAEQVHVMADAGFVGAASWWQRPQHEWRPGERLLACAAAAVADLREAVRRELGYTCSAGIAHTKLMAKLCSGLHKPAQQTVLPADAVPILLGPLPIPKLRGLGGKFGEQVMSELGIGTVGELASTPLPRLEAVFGEKDAQLLAALARGITDDTVEERKLAKSVSCGKTFRGRQALRDLHAVHTWLLELAGELSERIEADREDNNRVPTLLTVSFGSHYSCVHAPAAAVEYLLPHISPILLPASGFPYTSRSCPLRKVMADAMADDATALIKRWAAEQGAGWSLSSLGLAAGNFVSVQSPASAITRFFKPAPTLSADEQHREQQQQQQQQEERQEERQDLHHQEHPQPAEMHEQQAEQKPAGPTSLQSEGKTPAQTEQLQQEADAQQGAAAPAGSGSSWSAAEARQHQADAVTLGRGSSAGPSDAYNAASGSLEAAVCTAAGQAGPSGSNSRHSRLAEPGEAGQLLAGEVDESVLAELPPELQREIRAQLKTQQMAQRLEKRTGSGGTGSTAGGRGAGGGSGRSAAAAGGAAVKRSAAPAGVQRIDAFLMQAAKGKMPRK
ncbi:hypothetical protein ABPG77_008906 [Micractinium sp. CCAP 211/92]